MLRANSVPYYTFVHIGLDFLARPIGQSARPNAILYTFHEKSPTSSYRKRFACELQTKNIHVVSTHHCKILACYSSAGFFDFLKWSNLFFNPSPTFFPVVLLLRMLPSNSEYFIELLDVNPVVSAWLPLELR